MPVTCRFGDADRKEREDGERDAANDARLGGAGGDDDFEYIYIFPPF